MYPTTGFTPTMTELEITCNQLAAARFFRQSNRELGQVDAVAFWTRRAKDAIRKLRELRKPPAPSFVDDFSTLSTRRYAVEEQMNDATSIQELNACVDELLEIDRQLAPFEQVGDARLMMKYGGGL